MVSKAILGLERKYKNQSNVRIGRDFIQPCLKECKKYRRGTGTFSSSAFKSYINAIDHFIDDDIKIEILCSPKIDFPLYETLKNCNSDKDRDDIIQELTNNIAKIAAGFKDNPKDQDYRSLLIAYLITNKKLEIKIAQPLNFKAIHIYDSSAINDEDPDMDDVNTRAMYHIKYGYFEFEDNIKVAFEGSVNETDTAFNMNSEKATVFRSWESKDTERMEDIISDLDIDWNGENKDIKLYEIDDETLKVISEHVHKYTNGKRPIKKINNPVNPSAHKKNNSEIKLREYQEKALSNWKKNNYRGILAMATGSGKTRTAISAIKNIQIDSSSVFTIVVVPKINLALQWLEEFNTFGLKAMGAFTNQNWESKLDDHLFSLDLNEKYALPIIVVVRDTFSSKKFQDKIRHINATDKFIVVDECHHFNKIQALNKLPEDFTHRLGLSATPFNQYEDGEDDQLLNRYFDKTVFEYTLKQALDEEFLTPYNYYIVPVSLNEEETEALEAISLRIAKVYGIVENNGGTESQKSLDILYAEKNRLLASVKDKLTKLKGIASKNTENFALAYCGASSDEDDEGVRKRHIQRVSKIFSDLNWRVGKITSDENIDLRKQHIKDLENKLINVIVSIRVLDEGIDIPCCQTAYILASSKSNREFIQRRGRVLRRHEGKSHANIYDFVICNGSSKSESINKVVKEEFYRVNEFAMLAKNKKEIYSEFRTELSEYDNR